MPQEEHFYLFIKSAMSSILCESGKFTQDLKFKFETLFTQETGIQKYVKLAKVKFSKVRINLNVGHIKTSRMTDAHSS